MFSLANTTTSFFPALNNISGSLALSPTLVSENDSPDSAQRQVQLDQIHRQFLAAIDEFQKQGYGRVRRQTNDTSCAVVRRCQHFQRTAQDPSAPAVIQQTNSLLFNDTCVGILSPENINRCPPRRLPARGAPCNSSVTPSASG